MAKQGNAGKAMIKLYPHQIAAIQATDEHRTKGHKAGAWSMPTGSGKSYAFLSVAKRWNMDTLVLVHRDELVRQTVKSAGIIWPDASVGVIQASRNEWDGGLHEDPKLVIASVQSLHERRLNTIPRNRFGLVIADELHHYCGKNTWSAPLAHFNEREFLLGVSATPERADGADLSEWFGREPIYTYSLRTAIDDGMLAPITQFAIETSASLDDVKNRMGDFAENQLAQAVNMPGRNRAIVEAYQTHAAERLAVCFCVNVAHVEDLHGCFKQAGVDADFIHGGLAIDDRRERLARFADGDTRIMVNCQILTEGYDNPAVDCGIMARPTQSRPLYVQMVGRILRLHPGKKDALVLDITDNCRRHSLVTALDLMGSAGTTRSVEGGDVVATVDEECRQAVAAHELPRQDPLSWRLTRICPWPDMPTLAGYSQKLEWQIGDATESQRRYLMSFGVKQERNLSKGEASWLIDRCRELQAGQAEPATSKQEWYLKKQKAWRDGLTKQEASRRIGQLKRRQPQGVTG